MSRFFLPNFARLHLNTMSRPISLILPTRATHPYLIHLRYYLSHTATTACSINWLLRKGECSWALGGAPCPATWTGCEGTTSPSMDSMGTRKVLWNLTTFSRWVRLFSILLKNTLCNSSYLSGDTEPAHNVLYIICRTRDKLKWKNTCQLRNQYTCASFQLAGEI